MEDSSAGVSSLFSRENKNTGNFANFGLLRALASPKKLASAWGFPANSLRKLNREFSNPNRESQKVSREFFLDCRETGSKALPREEGKGPCRVSGAGRAGRAG